MENFDLVAFVLRLTACKNASDALGAQKSLVSTVNFSLVSIAFYGSKQLIAMNKYNLRKRR